MWLNKKNSNELFLCSLLFLTAFILRLYDLDARPLHHDESLHSFYSWVLAEGGGYKHTPMMHGPFQFEMNAIIFRVFGDNEFTSRLLYATVGSFIVILPFCLKTYMSKFSIIIASVMLTVSPSLLYFSRFSRNDIIMSILIMGLIVCLWKFLSEGRAKYIYFASGIIALCMATKESAFLIIAILGFYLLCVIIQKNIPQIIDRANPCGENPLKGTFLIIKESAKGFRYNYKPLNFSRHTKFLIILIIISLPQWSSAISIFQSTALFSWTGLTLSQPHNSADAGNPIGLPGVVISSLIFAMMLISSIAIGFLSKWNPWFRAMIIFYLIWAAIYSNLIWIVLYSIPLINFTFETTPKEMIDFAFSNLGSGSWRQLSYWIEQQEVARGSQPWYYYFILASIYEYLPFVFSATASIYYYFNRKSSFALFLVYWFVSTFVIFMFVSEKMPWLLINLTLPMILLTAQFLGDISKRIYWPAVWKLNSIVLFATTPIFFISIFGFLIYPSLSTFLIFAILFTIFSATLIWAKHQNQLLKNQFFPAVTLVTALLMLILTIRTSIIANYVNHSIPKEMIVYAQTTPDLLNVLALIEKTSESTNQNLDIELIVDQTSGFTWPWIWYLRDYQNVSYPTGFQDITELPNSPKIVISHEKNLPEIQNLIDLDRYSEQMLLRHRWWFPEFDGTYRNINPRKIVTILTNRKSIQKVLNYWINRSGVEDKIGSENSFVFVSKKIDPDISPLRIKNN